MNIYPFFLASPTNDKHKAAGIGSKLHKGFTLIELMIVVAIIGILAAIAISAYQEYYTIRAQVSEGLNLAAEVKTAVSEFRSAKGRWSNTPSGDSTAAAMSYGVYQPTSIIGNYIQSVHVQNLPNQGPTIFMMYGKRVNTLISGKTLSIFAGLNPAGGVIWVCGTANPPAGATEVSQHSLNSLSVPSKYLPSDCRS